MFCEGSEKKQKISYRTFFNSKKTLDVYTGVLKVCIFYGKSVHLPYKWEKRAFETLNRNF